MPHVFISYKREDAAFVSTLEQKLREADIDSWTDANIQAGANWRITIDEHIKEAFALIVVMTPNAKKSEYVTYEWSYAMGLGLSILPIVLKTTKLHPKLDELQWINCTVPYKEPWENIISRVRSIYENFKVAPRIKGALGALDHWYPDERIRAIRSIEAAKYSAAIPKLLDIAKNDDVQGVRFAALNALILFRSPEHLQLIKQNLAENLEALFESTVMQEITRLEVEDVAPLFFDAVEQRLMQRVNAFKQEIQVIEKGSTDTSLKRFGNFAEFTNPATAEDCPEVRMLEYLANINDMDTMLLTIKDYKSGGDLATRALKLFEQYVEAGIAASKAVYPLRRRNASYHRRYIFFAAQLGALVQMLRLPESVPIFETLLYGAYGVVGEDAILTMLTKLGSPDAILAIRKYKIWSNEKKALRIQLDDKRP